MRNIGKHYMLPYVDAALSTRHFVNVQTQVHQGRLLFRVRLEEVHIEGNDGGTLLGDNLVWLHIPKQIYKEHIYLNINGRGV